MRSASRRRCARLPDDAQTQLEIFLQQVAEVGLCNHHQIDWRYRSNRRRTWLLVDHAHLAEDIALSKHGENHFATILIADDDLEIAVEHEIDVVGRVAGEHYRRAPRHMAQHGTTRDCLKALRWNALKHGQGSESSDRYVVRVQHAGSPRLNN